MTLKSHYDTMDEISKKIDWKNKLFLIADDDYYSYLILERLITNKNGKVIYVKDGADAVLYCLNREKIDIALIDLLMPKLNGYEAVSVIKHHRPNIVCIAQTAYGLSSEEKKCLDAGFDSYILKPIISSKFYKTVYSTLENNSINKKAQTFLVS